MIDIEKQRKKISDLSYKYASSQIETYNDSIFLPYITLPNAKGKGTMMEEYFYWFLNELGIKTEWIKTNENYDFIINNELKIELKVASIGFNDMVVFNQLHFGKDRKVDKFLLVIIKPNDEIDFFLVPKEDFVNNKIKVQKQHSNERSQCARLCMSYQKVEQILGNYKVPVDRLYKSFYN